METIKNRKLWSVRLVYVKKSILIDIQSKIDDLCIIFFGFQLAVETASILKPVFVVFSFVLNDTNTLTSTVCIFVRCFLL